MENIETLPYIFQGIKRAREHKHIAANEFVALLITNPILLSYIYSISIGIHARI